MFQKLSTFNRNLAIALVTSAPMLAMAQGTDPFDTVLADVTDKVTDYAGALVVLAGVAVVFMIGVKYVKKIRGAA